MIEVEMMEAEAENERMKEEFFQKLFEQFLRNEKHKKDQDSLLLEMFLSYIYFKTSDQLFKEFIQFIVDGTDARIEISFQTQREKGYTFRKENFRRGIFRHIAKNMKVLYNILRDSLILEQQSFLVKYNYMFKANSLDIVKQAAASLKKEDFFWLATLKLPLNKGYWNQVYDAVVRIAASDLYSQNSNIVFELEDNHPILKSIETKLRDEVNFEQLSEEMKRVVILPTLKEFFALDNPFCGRTKGVLLIENAISPSAVVEKDHEGSSTLADISPTAVVTSPEKELEKCIGMMRKKLTMLESKVTSQVSYFTPDIPVGDKKLDHRLQTSVSVADSTSDLQTSVSYLAGFLKVLKIPPQDALAFFKRKKKEEEVIATNEIRPEYQFTSFGEDDLIARNGEDGQIRSYATTNEEKVLAAGFCTCTVHAVRLLCLCTTASDLNLQKVLKIMVTDMKSDPWNVEEVLLGLKLNSQLTTFQSLALSFAKLIGQSTSYIGELSLIGISSTDQLIKKVKDHYHSNTENEGKKMLFVSVSGTPSVDNLVLPYVFHVQERKYKGLPDGELIDFASESDNNTDNVTFQTVGMIYSRADKPASLTFRFLTYSRCVMDGQYVVCEHRPLRNGEIVELHRVSHSQQNRIEEEPPPPQTLPVVLNKSGQSGQSLVGLILLRNDNQCSAEHPYLTPEIIRSIPNPTYSDNSDACNLTCLHLQILNTKRWLDDVLVQAIAHIMFRLLLSNKGTVKVKICLRSSLDYEYLYESVPGRGGKYTERYLKKWKDMINSNDYIFYIVNVDNNHWICLCISMIHKRIFSVDSQNDRRVGKEKAVNVIKVWRELFDIELESVQLVSPPQRDGNSCGVFTFLNAAFLLKSILEGSFSFDGPNNMGKWSERVFSGKDKASIRKCAKDVIYGDIDGASLLNWIN